MRYTQQALFPDSVKPPEPFLSAGRRAGVRTDRTHLSSLDVVAQDLRSYLQCLRVEDLSDNPKAHLKRETRK